MAPHPEVEHLSPSLRAIMQLAAKGLTNPQIAGQVGLPESTVKLRIREILQRMGARSRTELVAMLDVRAADFKDVPLSTRMQQIVEMIHAGCSNKEIGRELGIAEATVKVHVKSILGRTQVRNRTQLASWWRAHLAAGGASRQGVAA
ncbi:LuxR C-terminal-related transcriptional regulator [Arenibaculum pallidiluteum]|uniref:LuxR C-terminal-related transcriptional regulator n=1 Tax=Arenibaculum pallidiluteum TaxID=2812559 RepID=UPI001A969244|nr:LuxR C-terminal-related transcriptional regulator [Arenibaculum pallidiluteum]